MRRLAIAGLLALAGVLIAACTPPTGYKPLLSGIVDKGSETYFHLAQPYPVIDLSEVAASSPGLTGTVVDVSWSQLEPSRGTFDFSTLDADLAAVSAYNSAHPGATSGSSSACGPPTTPRSGPRPWTGHRSRPTSITSRPRWASGGSLTTGRRGPACRRPSLSVTTTILYQRSGGGVMRVPHGRADGHGGDPDVRSVLLADGWTNATQQACLDGALSDYAPWHHTAIYFPFSPFTTISSSGQRGIDDSVTAEVMQRCANSLSSGGPWCILGNNALDASQSGSFVYGEINSLYASDLSNTAVAFQ